MRKNVVKSPWRQTACTAIGLAGPLPNSGEALKQGPSLAKTGENPCERLEETAAAVFSG